MALGDNVSFADATVSKHGPFDTHIANSITRPAQISSAWTIIHTTPETHDHPTGSDGAVNLRPDLIVSAGTQYVDVDGRGTSLVLMHRYDDAETSGTSPIIYVFGRSGTSDPWCRLKNKSDSITATLTIMFSIYWDATRFSLPSKHNPPLMMLAAATSGTYLPR